MKKTLNFLRVMSIIVTLVMGFSVLDIFNADTVEAQTCYMKELYCRPASGLGGCSSQGQVFSTSPSLGACPGGGVQCPIPPSSVFVTSPANCGITPPAINCVGSWSSYGACSASCGGGTQTRTYNVSVPASGGGTACPYADGATQTRDCNTTACVTPVNCEGSWSSYGACSASCGGGTQTRTYNVTTPASGGGTACPYADGATQQQACNTQACADPAPVNCLGYWDGSGSSCSNTCGLGTKQESFVVLRYPSNGGTSCPSSPKTVGCSDYSGCPMPQPDLVSDSLTMTSGTLEVGDTITIEGRVSNNGSANTGSGFSNRLRYALGSGSWNNISQLISPALAVSTSDTGSDTLVVPDSVGSALRLQYCADTPANAIAESNELNNCRVVNLGNITAPPITSCPSGYTLVGTNCIEDLPDLEPAVSVSNNSLIPDSVNGTYDMTSRLVIMNTGLGALSAGSNVNYRLLLDYSNNGSVDDTKNGTFNDSISAGDPSGNIINNFSDVPFGTHRLCAQVNLNPYNDTIDSDSSNNETCIPVNLAAVPPTMNITANGESETIYVRQGDDVTIDWEVRANYELSCEVIGRGLPTGSFSTVDGAGNPINPITDTTDVTDINNSTTFTLTCTEPITNTPFTDSVTVEVVPSFEEI